MWENIFSRLHIILCARKILEFRSKMPLCVYFRSSPFLNLSFRWSHFVSQSYHSTLSVFWTFTFWNLIGYYKLGCVVRMVVDSILAHAECQMTIGKTHPRLDRPDYIELEIYFQFKYTFFSPGINISQ